MITTESGEKHTLPTEVREHATTKTSVYKAGTLVYDGATGEGVGRSNLEGPGQSLNEMLKWSIEQSDPSELARRAAEGAAPPSQIDREIMDMLLGQPTVAKMRECLGKLEAEALVVEGGLDAGAAALEELEYYAEDLDNAHDLVRRRTLFLLASLAEERELATGTIAAAVDDGMIRSLLNELSSEDEDVRTPTGRLLVAISGEGVAAADGVEACAALARRAASVGGEAVCEAALARVAAADAESVDPEEAGRLRLLAGRFKQHA